MLLEHLATGGMAEIYRASAQGAHGFEKSVVIKRILPELAGDSEFLDMFIAEAKVMVRLSHPKIVQVLDFGEVDAHYFIAMEYVDGIDALALLRHCAKQRTRPSTGIAVQIVAEVLDALDYAHTLSNEAGEGLGIVHRDISPSNIFISRHGEVKLGDFGIAQAGTRDGTSAISMRGKYGYMSPEQVAGKPVDARADVFAAGIVLAELLMVRRLFMADSDIEVLLQVRDAHLDRLEKFGSRIPEELRSILLAALTRDPNLRYQNAASFRDALQRYLFDNRRMVRTSDVRAFLQRLQRDDPRGKLDTGPPQPAVARRRTPLGVSLTDQLDAVGHKRRIRLRPPPTPAPLPSISTTEEARLNTDEARAALPELGGVESGSASGSFPHPRSASRRVPSLPELDVDPSLAPPGPTGMQQAANDVAAERTTPIAGVPAMPPADLAGRIAELQEPSVVGLLFRVAAEEETGLLMLQRDEEVKEIHLVDGDPRSVASNRGDELFGQYLVRKRVISNGELSMALAMLPHFDGKLGDTLVALKLLRPVQVLRYLTHQVRQKLLEVFAWNRGSYFLYRGQRTARGSAPLGLDAFELIGTGVSMLEVGLVEARLSEYSADHLEPVVPAPMPPEIFRLGRLPRQAYEKHDGQRPLGQLLDLYDRGDARDSFLRMTYLLVETGLLARRA
jgi:serine/threonine protein kinase